MKLEKVRFKRVLILTSLLLSAISRTGTADNLPPYLSAMTGTIFTSLLDSATFSFQPGQLVQCTKSPNQTVATWNCTLSNASATVTDATRGTRQYLLTSVVLLITMPSNGPCYDFRFTGTYADKTTSLQSGLTLGLYYYSNAPSAVRGTLALTDFGVGGNIMINN